MKTIYLIWKDPTCAGINPEWQEITGQEFYDVVRSPEGKGRHFIKLYSTEADGNDGAIVMEATKDEYVRWRKEKDHTDYIREHQQASGIETVHYNAYENDDGEVYGEELLEDKDCDIETEYVKSHQLDMALAMVTAEERKILEALFLSAEKQSEQVIAEQFGISQQVLNYRKKQLLKKLKNFFED